ncbi:MAG: hypothetical protein ACYC7F_06305, partial [Gemmatimonadaceae bacterium]
PPAPALTFDGKHKQSPLALERRVTFFGFELSREREPVHEFPAGLEGAARRVLAEAMARGEAHHASVQKNRQDIEEVREAYRRSGGATPRLGLAELTAWYERAIAGVRDVQEWRAARALLDADDFVPRDERLRLRVLPGAVDVRDRAVPIDYEVEDTPTGVTGVARLRLPEKIARTLVEEELPALDRPLRFAVVRGARGTVKAATLPELQERLDDPFTDDELARPRNSDHGFDRNRPARGGLGGRGNGARGNGARGNGARGNGARGNGARGNESRGNGGRGSRDQNRAGGNPWNGASGGDVTGAGRHRPGSPSGRGKRRGK